VTTKLIVSLSVLTIGALLTWPAAVAHHSRVNFDLDAVIEISGTVARWQYRNPHAFLHLDVINDEGETERWVVELGSIVNLKQIDMHRDTLAVGDTVTVLANPEKNPRNNYVFFKSLTTDDGRQFAFADVFKYSPNAAAKPGESGSTDFTGIWDEVATPRSSLITAGPPDYPVTAAGKAILDRYDPAEEPGNTCGEDGLPKLIRSLYAIVITKDADAYYQEYEFYGVQRTIHMNTRERPADIAPSDYGHSIGWMEGDTLVVDTIGFKPAKWGIGDGLDSSEQKRVVERYVLKDEGRLMEVTYTVTDPVYLAEPFSQTHAKRFVPGYEITEYEPCDPEAARMHLDIEQN
jgi:hypothetical protein